jgi:hypothetical protein
LLPDDISLMRLVKLKLPPKFSYILYICKLARIATRGGVAHEGHPCIYMGEDWFWCYSSICLPGEIRNLPLRIMGDELNGRSRPVAVHRVNTREIYSLFSSLDDDNGNLP